MICRSDGVDGVAVGICAVASTASADGFSFREIGRRIGATRSEGLP